MGVKDAPFYTQAFDFWSSLRLRLPQVPKLAAQGPFQGWRAYPILYAPFLIFALIAVDAVFFGRGRALSSDEYGFLRGFLLMQHFHCIFTFHLLFFSDAGRELTRACAGGRRIFWMQGIAVGALFFVVFAFGPRLLHENGFSPTVAMIAFFFPYNLISMAHGLRQTQGLGQLLNDSPAEARPAIRSASSERKEYSLLLGVFILGHTVLLLRNTRIADWRWLLWIVAAIAFVQALRIVIQSALQERNFWKTLFLSRLLFYPATFLFPFTRLVLCWHAFEYLAVYSAFLKQDRKYARAARSWTHMLFWVPVALLMMAYFPASPISKFFAINRGTFFFDLVFGLNMAIAGVHYVADAKLFKLSSKEHRKVLDPIFFS